MAILLVVLEEIIGVMTVRGAVVVEVLMGAMVVVIIQVMVGMMVAMMALRMEVPVVLPVVVMAMGAGALTVVELVLFLTVATMVAVTGMAAVRYTGGGSLRRPPLESF